MLKNLLTLSILCVFSFNQLNAQKLTIKNKTVAIDNTEVFKIEKDKVVDRSFYLNDMNNNHLLYFKLILRSNDEPNYFEAYNANDLDTILFEEIDITISFKKSIIKKLFRADVLTTNGINNEELAIVSKKIGKEFSRRRDRNYNKK